MSGARLAPAMGLRAMLDGLRGGTLPGLATLAAARRHAPPGLVRLAPGLLALLAATVLFLALGPGGNGRRVSAAALSVAARLRTEDEALARALRPPPAAAAPAPVPQRFLHQVVAAAGAAGLRVTRLAPVQHADGLELEATARFPGLMRFAAEVELARGTLRGLRVRAGPDGSLELAVTLDPPHDPTPASATQAAAVRAAVAAAPRDPFGMPQAAAPGARRLTGITVLDGGALMATVDGRDYRAGDALGEEADAATVHAVGPDWAELSQDGRTTRLHLAAPGR